MYKQARAVMLHFDLEIQYYKQWSLEFVGFAKATNEEV